MDNTHLESGYITRKVPLDTPRGTVCVFDATDATGQTLKPWAAADAAANAAAQLFITCGHTLTLNQDQLVNCAIVGTKAGSVLALAAAGTYVAGAPVYLADDGKITPTAGTRQVGTSLTNATITEEELIEIVPLYVPAAAASNP